MSASATLYDRDVSVLKLVDLTGKAFRIPKILALNEDKTFFVKFPPTPALRRILGGERQAFIRGRFVGQILVFGERVKSWEPELDALR